MGTGREIETRGHIVGFKEEIGKTADLSPEAFLTWFDDASGPEESFVRGAWDFSVHVAQPLAPYLRAPEEKTILEIGHGAGRILASAARHFREAVGIDVHHRNDIVRRELATRGITNVRLLETDGAFLCPMEPSTSPIRSSCFSTSNELRSSSRICANCIG